MDNTEVFLENIESGIENSKTSVILRSWFKTTCSSCKPGIKILLFNCILETQVQEMFYEQRLDFAF